MSLPDAFRVVLSEAREKVRGSRDEAAIGVLIDALETEGLVALDDEDPRDVEAVLEYLRSDKDGSRVLRALGRDLRRWVHGGDFVGFGLGLSSLQWKEVVAAADLQALAQVLPTAGLLRSRLANAIGERLAKSGDPQELVEPVLGELVSLLPNDDATCESSALLTVALPRAVTPLVGDLAVWTDWLESLARMRDPPTAPPEALRSLVERALPSARARVLLRDLQPNHLANLARHAAPLAGAIVRADQPEAIARLQKVYRDERRSSVNALLSPLLQAAGDDFARALLAEVASGQSEEQTELDPDTAPLSQLYGSFARAAGTDEPLARALLWLWRTFHALERQRERIAHEGLELGLERRAREAPDAWARMLPLLLSQEHELQTIEAITLQVASSAASVGNALDVLRSRRDWPVAAARAEAIAAALQGFEDPDEAVDEAILSALARRLDRRPVHPHPLEHRSATWIGSGSTEAALRATVSRAAEDFREAAKDHLGISEPRLVTMLLERLRKALAVPHHPVRPGGGNVRSELTIQTRESAADEKRTGLDVALVVQIDLPGVMRAEHAEFVQVKKVLRKHGTGDFLNKWQIDVSQMETLLGTSASAAYWLFGLDGQVEVVPAHFMAARLAAKSKPLKKMNVGFNEVRSTSIPLDQWLVDLLIGLWIGSSSTRALEIARGNDPHDQPLITASLRVSGRERRSRS